MSSSSFLNELFDPGRWPMRFLRTEPSNYFWLFLLISEMKLDTFYHLKYSDYCLHPICYIQNVNHDQINIKEYFQ